MTMPKTRAFPEPTHPESAWLSQVGAVIASIGETDLPRRLDTALRQLAAFDLSVVFAYPIGNRPLDLYDGLATRLPGKPLRAYLDGAYLVDPFYVACAEGIAPGLYRMRDIAPDAFFDGVYVNDWQVHPCISMNAGSLAEEIGYVVELPDGLMAVYSLMRSAGRDRFGAEEFARLQEAEPIVREVLRRQWPRSAPEASEAAAGRTCRQTDRVLDRAFATFSEDVLSAREQTVSQMILRGHSSRSIARVLGIAEGTVKNHRKKIYAKLGIGSQQELFSLFLRHALDDSIDQSEPASPSEAARR